MSVAVKNIDYALAQLIRNNEEKIKSITPKKPVIEKSDEWRNEDEWDELHKELTNK